MGWVTLSLRQMEDKVVCNNLELELLQLNRRRMQFLRQQNAKTASKNRERQQELKTIKNSTDFESAKDEMMKIFNAMQQGYDDNGKSKATGDFAGKTKDDLQTMLSEANLKYTSSSENLTELRAAINNFYDQECADIEEETTEQENEFDMEQTEIETQLQAIRSELEAVGQQVSADIKSTQIKLG